MEIVHPDGKKIEKKEQMSIDDDETKENTSVENILMKNVKIKNEFKEEQEKNKNKLKDTYPQCIKERMGEYYGEKPFKIHAKRKKDKYGEILAVITKNNENAKRKNPAKAQTMTVESKRAKIMTHPRQRKKLRQQKMAENNSKLILSGKFDFDPEEILDELLLFDLKKTSEEKMFDSILEKIRDKNNIYYIEHRKGTNAFGIRKGPEQAEKDELITMLETVDRGIKRTTSKSKLSQLKRIKK